MGEPSSEREASPKTILVVEDEVIIRLDTAYSLMDAGFKVIEAATADDALKVLSGPESVDLILTDIRMPGTMDGLGLVQRVRSEWPHIKIVVASGHFEQLVSASVPDALLRKPYLLKVLIGCVGRLLAKAHDGQS